MKLAFKLFKFDCFCLYELLVYCKTITQNQITMQKYFELDAKEKKQEWLMIAFAIIAFITIGKGVYNQFYKIDEDIVLIPLVMATFSGYFLFYGINGITKGNVLSKYTPFYIFQSIVLLVIKTGGMERDKAKRFTTIFLGITGLIISAISFSMAIFVLMENR
jgi:hypothetical protein